MGVKKEQAPGEPSGAAIVIADRIDMQRAAQVASVVETKSTIPILANMLIEASGDELAMTATDLDIAVRVVVPARCEGNPLATTVEAKRIAALVGAADDGCQIRLTYAAGARAVEMKAVRSRFTLPVLPREDMPLIAFDEGAVNFSVDAKLLGTTLARTADAECEAARAAVDEMALCARGVDWISRVIQIAKKHERGIVDQERAVAEPYPIPGLRVGSTLAAPKLAKAS